MDIKELHTDSLYHRCDLDKLSFEATEELDDLTESIGQPQAVEVLRFGTGIRSEGYNNSVSYLRWRRTSMCKWAALLKHRQLTGN